MKKVFCLRLAIIAKKLQSQEVPSGLGGGSTVKGLCRAACLSADEARPS
jgi:hypothetical protein